MGKKNGTKNLVRRIKSSKKIDNLFYLLVEHLRLDTFIVDPRKLLAEIDHLFEKEFNKFQQFVELLEQRSYQSPLMKSNAMLLTDYLMKPELTRFKVENNRVLDSFFSEELSTQLACIEKCPLIVQSADPSLIRDFINDESLSDFFSTIAMNPLLRILSDKALSIFQLNIETNDTDVHHSRFIHQRHLVKNELSQMQSDLNFNQSLAEIMAVIPHNSDFIARPEWAQEQAQKCFPNVITPPHRQVELGTLRRHYCHLTREYLDRLKQLFAKNNITFIKPYLPAIVSYHLQKGIVENLAQSLLESRLAFEQAGEIFDDESSCPQGIEERLLDYMWPLLDFSMEKDYPCLLLECLNSNLLYFKDNDKPTVLFYSLLYTELLNEMGYERNGFAIIARENALETKNLSTEMKKGLCNRTIKAVKENLFSRLGFEHLYLTKHLFEHPWSRNQLWDIFETFTDTLSLMSVPIEYRSMLLCPSQIDEKLQCYHDDDRLLTKQMIDQWKKETYMVLTSISPESNIDVKCLLGSFEHICSWSSHVIEHALDCYHQWTSIDRAVALNAAIKDAHLPLMNELIENGAEEHLKTHFDESALMCALKEGNDIAIGALLECPAELGYQKRSDGTNALIQGVVLDNPNLLQIIPHMNTQQAQATDFQGKTALHYATELGRVDLIFTLTTRVIDPEIRDYSGRTALHYAIINEDTPIVSSLLDNGANPCTQNNRGQNALHLSLAQQYRPTCLSPFLQDYKLNVADNDGNIPLQMALAQNDHLIVKMLIMNGHGLTHIDSTKCCIASIYNKLKKSTQSEHIREWLILALDTHSTQNATWKAIVFGTINYHQRRILSHAATREQLNITNDRQYSLLQHAITQQSRPIIAFLIRKRVMINYQHPEHGSALQMACQLGDFITVKDLIASKATMTQEQANKCMQTHTNKEQKQCIKLLLKHYKLSAMDLLKKAIAANDVSTLLLACNQDQKATLHSLITTNNRKLLTAVLNKKPLFIEQRNERGYTLLATAVENHCLSMTKLLLSRGADVNCIDNQDHSLTDYSIYQQSYQLRQLLQSHSANLENVALQNVAPLELH